MQETPKPLTSQERLQRRGICVIVPTYNNEGTIADVVQRCKAQCADVIVVNDGSTDSTASILANFKDIVVVTLEHNSGKGTALKNGFIKAIELGFAYAITLDADGQHYPEDIPVLLQANIDHPGALILGRRKNLEKQERSGGSKFANAFSNFWFAVQTCKRLEDTQTGFRLYPLHKLKGLSLLTSRYEAELELLVFSTWHGVELVSVPINVYYPPKEERVSHFRPAMDFTRISILNTILCILAVVYGLPLWLYRKVAAFIRTIYSLIFFLIYSVFVMTPYAVIYMGIGSTNDNKRDKLHNLLCWIARIIMLYQHIPGTKFIQRHNTNETLENPSVIICNHQSHLDLMAMLMQKRKMIILTNDWVYNNFCYGYFLHQAEFYPVSMGLDKILPKLRMLVKRGYSIVVYPEGTRSMDGKIARFHEGAFYIAEQLNLDIAPIILYGAGRVLPKKAKLMRKGIISLDFDPHFSNDKLKHLGETMRSRAKWMRQYYIRRYEEICDEYDQLA